MHLGLRAPETHRTYVASRGRRSFDDSFRTPALLDLAAGECGQLDWRAKHSREREASVREASAALAGLGPRPDVRVSRGRPTRRWRNADDDVSGGGACRGPFVFRGSSGFESGLLSEVVARDRPALDAD